jgi:hypothetical protein
MIFIAVATLMLSKKGLSKEVLVRRLLIVASIGIAISGVFSAISTWNNTMNGVELNPLNASSELEQLMVMFFAPGAAMLFFMLALLTFVMHLILIGILWLIYFIIKKVKVRKTKSI